MERIIPSLNLENKFNQSLTEGERHLINFLDSVLKKDENFKYNDSISKNQNFLNYNGWLIFVTPHINGIRPDIVLLHPKVGCQIIEVKDWYLEKYSIGEDMSGEGVFVKKSDGYQRVLSPLKQVEYYKNIVFSQLVLELGFKSSENKKLFGLVKSSIYFHNSQTKEAIDFFNGIKNRYVLLFGRDKLKKEHINDLVPDENREKSFLWKIEWSSELLNWLNPPYHTLEQTQKLNLIYNQKKIAEPSKGHHRVRGIAGSGKTQVLAYRAAKLASFGYSVLILTFNKTLWHYIKDMVSRAPFEFEWSKIEFNHFHGFCKDTLVNKGVDWINKDNVESQEFLSKTIPAMVKETIINSDITKYDAIMIDEGQDFEFEWYDLITYIISERDELLIVSDKKQNIYERDLTWIDKRRTGLQKFGDWIELNINIRLPYNIANLANLFAEKFDIEQDILSEKRPPQNSLFKEHTVWRNTDSCFNFDLILSAYDFIRKNAENNHPSDIVILVPNNNFGQELVDVFKKRKGLNVNHTFKYKNAFWNGNGSLKITTVHSFKGWEAMNVIVLIPKNSKFSNEVVDKLVYVAITRTRQNIIILNSNNRYNEFGLKFPQKWADNE